MGGIEGGVRDQGREGRTADGRTDDGGRTGGIEGRRNGGRE